MSKVSVPLCAKELLDKVNAIDEFFFSFATNGNINSISNHVEEMQIKGKSKVCKLSFEIPSAKCEKNEHSI